MRLYGHPWSINTRKALVVLAEKGHEAELVYVDIPHGGQRLPEHVARHPFGKLPVLDDGDFRVYETAAVLQYLDALLPGPSLAPSDARARARALQWDRVQQSYFEPHAHPLIVHAQFSRVLGFPGDPAIIDAGRAAMQPALDVIDRHLRTAAYLTGDDFGLADVTWMPYLDYLTAIGEGEAVAGGRPGLAAWWDRISRRPSWQAVARSGLQPYQAGATADGIAAQSRGRWSGTPS
ncbi:MAG: glutathione S-transferase C-terminal domain-containing protein [Myxococcota bacterium]